MENSIGFVGCGRVVTILLGGWARAGVIPGPIVVSDPDPGAVARARTRYPSLVLEETDAKRAAALGIVFLALHPPAIKEAAPRIREGLRDEAVLVSLAPKLTVAALSGMLGGFRRMARMIPNAASIVGEGYNPVAFSEALGADERQRLARLFAPWGEYPEVPEAHLEAYAIVTAMGPTFLWPQLYELARLGESFGLPAKQAMEGVARMVSGAATTMKGAGLSQEEVMDLVPVKPLAEMDAEVIERYRVKLTAVMEKIRP
jgi:pyrroline-5-carboxylate reductase